MKHPLENARWIWPGGSHDLVNGYAQFRQEFRLSARPRQASIAITADQSYQLYLNGEYVCRGPARGFQDHWPFDEIPVARFLRRGRNVIAVRAYNPGCGNFQYVSAGAAGLLAAMHIGGTEVVSDGAWRARRQSGVRRDAEPASLQLPFQEYIDLREEPDDWMRPDFDDSSWTAPAASAAWNVMPWHALEPRGIPMLEESEVPGGRIIGEMEAAGHPEAAATRNVFRLRALEAMDHSPRTHLQWPLRSAPAGKDRFRSYLIDFGQTVVGCPEIQITGCAGGEMADLTHYETIDTARLCPDVDLNAHSRPALGCRVICRPGTNRHRFFLPYGFRYAVLTLRGTARPVRASLSLHTIGYPLAVRGRFTCSEPDLNRIWSACVHTQRVCMLDAYIDTPWREQAQWWGDARVTCQNTFHLANDARLMRRGIRSIAGQRVPNGLTYGHAPTIAHSCILPDFSLIWIITLWDYYWQTGELEPFHSHQDCLGGILEYFRNRSDPETHLVSCDRRYWLFLDWTTLHRQGFSTVLNLWLLIALEKTAELHRLSGQGHQARSLSQWARKLRSSLRAMIDSDGLLCDGRDEKGRLVRRKSVHSQTLALMAGLCSGSERAMLEKRLLPWIREERAFEAKPSAYWATYIFRMLQERGYGADVIRFIRKHWEPMADYGSTWENFVPRRGADSFSHAWSAHPISHFAQILGGITQTGPAWTAIRFAPALLTASGSVRVPTPQGMITSSWRQRRSGSFDVRLQLPEGVQAEIALPRLRAQCGKGSHRWQVFP